MALVMAYVLQALKWVAFPVQASTLLNRCCLPAQQHVCCAEVMMCGVLIARKKYTVLEWISAGHMYACRVACDAIPTDDREQIWKCIKGDLIRKGMTQLEVWIDTLGHMDCCRLTNPDSPGHLAAAMTIHLQKHWIAPPDYAQGASLSDGED
eukprot:1407903-Amphidinium_carterae.1